MLCPARETILCPTTETPLPITGWVTASSKLNSGIFFVQTALSWARHNFSLYVYYVQREIRFVRITVYWRSFFPCHLLQKMTESHAQILGKSDPGPHPVTYMHEEIHRFTRSWVVSYHFATYIAYLRPNNRSQSHFRSVRTCSVQNLKCFCSSPAEFCCVCLAGNDSSTLSVHSGALLTYATMPQYCNRVGVVTI